MYALTKIIRNEIHFVKSYCHTAKRYTIKFTKEQKQAMHFSDKETAKFKAESFQMATGKIFHIEKLPTEPMGKGSILNGSLIALLIIFLASCSPKITMFKVVKVNGIKFKVEGKRGVFIAPKDSVVTVGQLVPVKTIF